MNFSMICPLCKKGEILDPFKDRSRLKKELAIELRKRDYSMREIQKILGYKSVSSVAELLKV